MAVVLQDPAAVPGAFPRPARRDLPGDDRRPGSQEEVWDTLAGPLGLAGASIGERRSAGDGAPALAGVVERTGTGKHLHGVLLRLEKPAPGVAYVAAFTWGDKVSVMVSFYLYGEGAVDVAAREEVVWKEWVGERFPAPLRQPLPPADGTPPQCRDAS